MNPCLAGRGSSKHSGTGEGEIEHAWVGEEMKNLLDIPGLPVSCLNDIWQAEGLSTKNIVDISSECVLLTNRH